MKKVISMIVMTAASFGFMAASHAASTAKTDYEASKDRAEADYKVASANCDGLKDNAKDVCKAEAKAARVKARSEAEAAYKGTAKAHKQARIDIADANYDVAKQKCDDFSGNRKDVCIKEAKAAKIDAIANAKAAKEMHDTRKEANEDKKDADIAVQKEKCDSLAGAAKSQCIDAAKAEK